MLNAADYGLVCVAKLFNALSKSQTITIKRFLITARVIYTAAKMSICREKHAADILSDKSRRERRFTTISYNGAACVSLRLSGK